jgi:hypothetical protein
MRSYLQRREKLGMNQSRLLQAEPGSNVSCHPEVGILSIAIHIPTRGNKEEPEPYNIV